MKKIERFQITGMTIEGFKSYRETTDLVFGNPTTITGGNGRGKTSIADAIAFAITGQPFFGERGIDKLHNEFRPDVFISLRFVDEAGASHELTRTRHKNRMSIHYDGYEIRQLDLTDMFGERDVFLSIFNPLYFIEELGDDGKNLLEMYLPMISHEAVMDRLSEATRAALEGVNIFSPDAFLKSKRAEIRELEEHLIYLQGQKDQASTQVEAQKQAVAALTERHSLLDSELNALENKRFSGLDRTQMEAKLVELSACYEEAARSSGDTAEIDAQILALQQKLAQRRVEQYQSQYTQAIADASAKVTELGNRYRREAQIMKAFTPGVACPTCRRPVTEQNLSEVQGALQKVIDAIVADGREQQSQLKQLRELDTKAQVVFDQFQSDDIIKMQDEIEALTQQRDKLTEDRQTDDLRGEIQRLTASLEYGNLSQQEYDRLLACREEVRQCAAELNAAERAAEQEQPDFDGQIAQDKQEIKELKSLISNVVIYASVRAELIFESLKMNKVAISLYDVMKTTGEQKAAFKFTYDGRRYDRLSLSEKIRAGMEVSELVKRLTGRNYPVFVDNMESVDDLANVRPTGQVIMAKCVRGAPLEVRPLRPISVAGQKAA
ncbi:MAG: hypothetical protein HFF38_06660 [Lawsonibacter sp.]|nr:hypothetical protein [Lawsonibacter sp.]